MHSKASGKLQTIKLFLFWLAPAPLFIGPLFVNPLFADNSIFQGGELNGGGIIAPLPGQNPKVRLERQAFTFSPDTAQIEAEYVLRNEGEARRLTFCVPEYWGGSKTKGLKNLQIWVDGRRVHPLCKFLANSPREGLHSHTPYALWEAQTRLRRGQARHIFVSFTSWESGNEAILFLLHFPPNGWHGSVQRTDLSVRLHGAFGVDGDWGVRLFPGGWGQNYEAVRTRTVNHRLSYRWRNWKPSGFLMVVGDG